MIRIEHLFKTYHAGETDREHVALTDINLSIDDGEIFGIIGESGAGKSTLVRCINLLERPSKGRIFIDGRDVTDCTGRELAHLRQGIGMIFQNFSLFAQRSVLRNVTFPLELQHVEQLQARERAYELLRLVGLEGKANDYPSQLSGGQQQRVAIARALACKPSIILCDEATSALDTMTTKSILGLLADINRELGVTLVLITHSMNVAQAICHRVAVIDGGQIVEEGVTAEVFAHPQSSMARALLGLDDVDETAPAKNESANTATSSPQSTEVSA